MHISGVCAKICCCLAADAHFADQGVAYACIAGCSVRGNMRAHRRALSRYRCGSNHQQDMNSSMLVQPALNRVLLVCVEILSGVLLTMLFFLFAVPAHMPRSAALGTSSKVRGLRRRLDVDSIAERHLHVRATAAPP